MDPDLDRTHAMTRLDVRGKSVDEIAKLLEKVRRPRIYELIYELANIEEHYTPAEVARARRLTPRVIGELCKTGKIPGAHKPLENGWRISRRGLEQWDDATRVNPLRTEALSIPPAGFVNGSD